MTLGILLLANLGVALVISILIGGSLSLIDKDAVYLGFGMLAAMLYSLVTSAIISLVWGVGTIFV